MKNKKGLLPIYLGLLLVAAALFLVLFNLYDGMRAKKSAEQGISRLEEYCFSDTEDLGELEIPDYILNPDMDMPTANVNGFDYIGILRIPVLDLELPIISQWSYPNLKNAPCRYSGSAYLDNMIIAGHNYASHFGGLKNLSQGDIVTFTDIDGNVFNYVVVEQETLQPTAIDEMESGNWDLSLFTCTLGGKSRVTIRCERAEDEASQYGSTKSY